MPAPSAIDIRIVPPEEFATLGIGAYAFGKSPQKPDPERQQSRLKYAANTIGIAAFEDGEPQTSVVILKMTENVRGRILPMGGVGGVASFPQARRKGYVREMMTYGFGLMHERGDVVSTLYPFRGSFYERLGYAEMQTNRFTTIKPEHLGPLLKMDLPGTVTQEGMDTGFDEWWAFIERVQANRHGFSLQERERALELRDNNSRWVALVREEGTVTGAMTFEITGYGETLRADSFHAATPAARYQLLSWIGRHVDQVADAVIELGPDDYPELWFRDLDAQTSTVHKHAWPAPMGRVISIAGLAGIAAGDANPISIHITDDHCPWNTGVWTLGSDDGTLKVTPGGEASMDLAIQGLSALVWAGMDPATFRYRGWGAPTPDDQATLRALFPPAVPFLHEKF
ncbi:MAG TPA: GNAT family N-acetyltransferase [Thermomicrobiales bacterium]|nr:GNAT family N-acetyltransferase [Thermomicrobiales bacterium]